MPAASDKVIDRLEQAQLEAVTNNVAHFGRVFGLSVRRY
jgi:hypothetical protein